MKVEDDFKFRTTVLNYPFKHVDKLEMKMQGSELHFHWFVFRIYNICADLQLIFQANYFIITFVKINDCASFITPVSW